MVHLLLLITLFTSSLADKTPVHCRLPFLSSPLINNTTHQFVEYCPEEAWPRGIGNTLIYYPIVFYFAVFTGRDICITDLSSVGSVCRILKCRFPFTSEIKKLYPELKLSHSPRKVNYNLLQHFNSNSNNKTMIKNDIVNVNGYSGTLFPSFIMSITNGTKCVQQLSGCSKKDWTCMEHFAYRYHFSGGFHDQSVLPNSIVGVTDNEKDDLVELNTSTSLISSSVVKLYDIGIHIRAQLKSLEHNKKNTTLSEANFNLYNDTIFPHFNNYLTQRLYGKMGTKQYDKLPVVFVSVDDVSLKELLIHHLLTYRDSLYPIKVLYVNNSNPIKHAKHMRHAKASIEKKYFPSDVEMIPTMFDWYGISRSKFILSYRLLFMTILSSCLTRS